MENQAKQSGEEAKEKTAHVGHETKEELLGGKGAKPAGETPALQENSQGQSVQPNHIAQKSA